MHRFGFGMDVLLGEHRDWIRNARVGLVAHPASINTDGRHSAEHLRDLGDVTLSCVLGPEHGFDGAGGAGDAVGDRMHPVWGIPIYSLYGESRRPTEQMLQSLDVLLFDLQDLGVRCYTYVSTLRYVLEAAAEWNKRVIVCDRPIPLANTVDGPLLEENCRSFVGLVDTPLVYGMTPGETALWLRDRLKLKLDLRVAEMRDYHRESSRPAHWPEWVPPSPAIRAWETGHTYPATVFCEALPALEYGRRTPLAFQILSAPWLDGPQTCEALNALGLPGVRFDPHPDANPNTFLIHVTYPDAFKPVRTAVAVLETLGKLCGRDRAWEAAGTRPDFFDKLMGTARVRQALRGGEPARAIASSWDQDLSAFAAERRRFLLYSREPS